MQGERPVKTVYEPLAFKITSDPLSPAMSLELASHVRIEGDDHRIVQIDRGGTLVKLPPESGEMAAALVSKLPGRTLRDVASALGWELDETIEMAQQLYELAVLRNAGDTPVPALVFYQHIFALGQGIQFRLVEGHSLFARFLEENPHQRLLLGYLVELYHVVNEAATHIAPAILKAPNDRLRMMFSEYLSSEFWHGLWLRQGLIAAGLTEDAIERADPLPGSIGAINHLRWAASTDLLAYAACISTGEGAGSDEKNRTDRKFARLVRHKLLPDEAFEPFKLHDMEDANLGHLSYCAEPFAEAPPITRQHQDAIKSSMLLYLRALDEQHRQIARFYEHADGPPMFAADWIPT